MTHVAAGIYGIEHFYRMHSDEWPRFDMLANVFSKTAKLGAPRKNVLDSCITVMTGVAGYI